MLGVEVNSPDPVRLPVRAKTEGIYRQVVEPVAAGRCSGFVDQADGRAVIGIDAAAVLVEGATEFEGLIWRLSLDHQERASAILMADNSQSLPRRPPAIPGTGVRMRNHLATALSARQAELPWRPREDGMEILSGCQHAGGRGCPPPNPPP